MYVFVCVRMCVRVYTHTHTLLPCVEILAPPLSGEKGWRLDLEEGCPGKKGVGVGLLQKRPAS